MRNPVHWSRLIVLTATVKIAGSLAVWLWLGLPVKPNPVSGFSMNHTLGFAVVMALVGYSLVLPPTRDQRALFLGGFFVVAASAFLDSTARIVLRRDDLSATIQALLHFLQGLQPIAFMPFLFWAFLCEFPRRPRIARHYYFLDWTVRLLAVLGLALLLVNAACGVLGSKPIRFFSLLLAPGLQKPAEKGSTFLLLILALTLASLVLLAVRGRRTEGDERHRVRLLYVSLLIGLLPILVTTLLEMWLTAAHNNDRRWLVEALDQHPPWRSLIYGSSALCLLSLPLTMAYAVLVHRVLDFRVIARRAVHHALARTTVSAIVAVPLASLAGYLFLHRKISLEELCADWQFLPLAIAAGLGVWAWRYRPRLLEAVDRHFFREQYNAKNVLTSLAERIPRAANAVELAELILPGLDRALHPEAIFFLAEDPRRGLLVDPTDSHRQLDVTTALAKMIADQGRPFRLDLEEERSAIHTLPPEDRRWLEDNGIKLCVPIVAVDGSLLAALALGGKKSGLAFLREDRDLLSAIASSAAPVLELQRIRRTAIVTSPTATAEAARLAAEWDNARECPQCGQIFLPQTLFCAACDQRLETAGIPFSIPGKLRFERRIGVGGMGVVYRAADIALGRSVAVKTLRSVSAEQATRLRREARTAAAVAHQHLASIYGVESWHGMPMLILELFDGGTLAQRLVQSPLGSGEALELGIALSGALAQLHASDILHRDIKPSNIGFSREGVPKLTDFGIARFVYDLDRDLVHPATSLPAQAGVPSIWNLALTEESAEKLRGTLPYLSPEAVEGQSPDVSFDLWSLSIVLYESLIGRKIFVGQSPKQIMTRILLARLPDLRTFLPEAPPALLDLFRGLLHKDRRHRPHNALELRNRLEEVRNQLAA
jgi:hypothetical protein